VPLGDDVQATATGVMSQLHKKTTPSGAALEHVRRSVLAPTTTAWNQIVDTFVSIPQQHPQSGRFRTELCKQLVLLFKNRRGEYLRTIREFLLNEFKTPEQRKEFIVSDDSIRELVSKVGKACVPADLTEHELGHLRLLFPKWLADTPASRLEVAPTDVTIGCNGEVSMCETEPGEPKGGA